MKRFLLLFAAALPAFAGIGGGGVMPWEGPLALIATSLTGPTAASIGLIALVTCIVSLLWHPDMGQMGRYLSYIGIACAVLVLAGRFMLATFGVAGAVI